MITLEDVYLWLNKFGVSHLRPSSDRLLSQMRMALEEGYTEKAMGLLSQLKDLALQLRDGDEVSEFLIDCAYGAYKLDDLAEAETLLVDSVSRNWSNLHRRAVVQWMAGSVQWKSSPGSKKAVSSWRNSISDFEQLAHQPGLSPDQHVWYQDAWHKLNQSLVEAIQEFATEINLEGHSGKAEGTAPVPSEQVSISLLPAGSTETRTSGTPMPLEATVTRTSDILQLFTVSEEIPAGDFGPSGVDPFPIGTVELDCLNINGHPYSVHSTRGRRIINLPLDQTYRVVKVKGDSMDLENITSKDFVILRRVDVPANGDIVMAEIVGTDATATLKRYFKEKDTITLQPHSNNPIHKPFVFNKVNDGFYIRGVVIAVLKPV